jgi:uridylate kinase
MSYHETIVMSVGGSLIVPDQIDTAFLTTLKTIIEAEITRSRRFIIIAGGGKTARRYQEAAGSVAHLAAEDLDWMGIHATRLNGHLLRTIFRTVAHPAVITNPDDILDVPSSAPLIIAAGYRPGSSTDLRAVQIAERVGATRLINLSNIEYVYSDDPRTNHDAKPITTISWSAFRAMIPTEWDPGLSSPFDPVAAREAEAVAIISGLHETALQDYLADREFVGTRITV